MQDYVLSEEMSRIRCVINGKVLWWIGVKCLLRVAMALFHSNVPNVRTIAEHLSAQFPSRTMGMLETVLNQDWIISRTEAVKF